MIFWPSLQLAQVGYDLPALAEAYDWFNVMDYDYHGAWENFTGEAVVMMTSQGTTLYCTVLYCTVPGHNTPLYGRHEEDDEHHPGHRCHLYMT